MSIKAVLFDLDGTLLPMDYDGFLKLYFGNLAKRLAKYGYDPDMLVKNIWTGTKAMVMNDGSCMNENKFWDVFAEIYGVLATNPIFPMVATRQRIAWAGLTEKDFELCTTYENIGVSKPNPAYYTEIAKRIGVAPEECLMVGNDVAEDMVAEKAGMKVFLLTDCLLNKNDADISCYPQGGFEDLQNYLKLL